MTTLERNRRCEASTNVQPIQSIPSHTACVHLLTCLAPAFPASFFALEFVNETGDAARFFSLQKPPKMSKNSYRPLHWQVPVFFRAFPAERMSKVN